MKKGIPFFITVVIVVVVNDVCWPLVSVHVYERDSPQLSIYICYIDACIRRVQGRGHCTNTNRRDSRFLDRKFPSKRGLV